MLSVLVCVCWVFTHTHTKENIKREVWEAAIYPGFYLSLFA